MYDAARTGRVKLKKSLPADSIDWRLFHLLSSGTRAADAYECRFVWCQLIAFCVTFFRLVT